MSPDISHAITAACRAIIFAQPLSTLLLRDYYDYCYCHGDAIHELPLLRYTAASAMMPYAAYAIRYDGVDMPFHYADSDISFSFIITLFFTIFFIIISRR